jgi:microcystin degradation protein MlrC
LPAKYLICSNLKRLVSIPQNKHVVALKSMQHFRAAFEPIAGQVIVCDSGALCTPQYNRLPYRNVPRPIFPLDQIRKSDCKNWLNADKVVWCMGMWPRCRKVRR